jgi:hypothetical protein
MAFACEPYTDLTRNLHSAPSGLSKTSKFKYVLMGFVPLLIYWGITQTVAPGGCPIGYTGPGGKGDQGKHYQCTGGGNR